MNNYFDDNNNEMSECSPTRVMPIITEIHHTKDEEPVVDENGKMSVAMLALRDMVLFPGMTMPVAVGREKSLKAVREASKKHQRIGVFCQIDRATEDPGQKDLYNYGTLAEIIKVIEMPDGSVNVILQGRVGLCLDEVTETVPYLKGMVSLTEEIKSANRDTEFKVLISSITEVTFNMLANMGDSGRELAFAMKNIDNSYYLINFLATNVQFDPEKKQAMLEERNMKKRGYMLYSYLRQEAQFVEIKAEIQSRTREDISQQQREHFLQQQIRTIQEELGAAGGDDIDVLENRALKKKWSDKTNEQFQKELRKLERLNPQSPDYAVQFAYLDNFLNLPWLEYSKDNFDLKKVEKKLDKDHYGLDDVKNRILEHLSVLKLRGDLKAPIICLYGPPGVGKTSLGRSVAEALNRKYARISLGGLHDEAEIRGHRRTYIGAMPGRIIDAMIKSGTSNPVIVLDEIDKVGKDYKGDPSNALLEVLDPEQNNKFHDNYLDVDYDLSKVLFITTANDISGIHPALKDRMEMINVSGYLAEEKVSIAKNYLVPKQLEAHGLTRSQLSFGKGSLETIIDEYTRESGVRGLDKQIAKMARITARKIALEEELPKRITPAIVKDYLGLPTNFHDLQEDSCVPGVVTGLAWTQVGGEILFIECSLNEGKGNLSTTGNLGDVMKESVTIALQYLKAHPELAGVTTKDMFKKDIHIHVPEGAIPKDGPSAGITMATAIASAFRKKPVKNGIAMTGEITLRGKVLPVGGIKEKILAAKRAGVTTIILSRKNEKDIKEINPIYVKGLSFEYVDTIDDVISKVF